MQVNAQNFRDIKSVAAGAGKHLRAGMLYRTGDMSNLSEDSVRMLGELGIQSVVDLRSKMERRHHPYEWLPGVDTNPWGDPAEKSAASIAALVARADATADQVREAMRDLYRELPTSHAESYAELMRRIAEGRVPIVFGCAAGKDRTGVAAALLLWMLGVERDAIVADYLETNAAIDGLRALIKKKYRWDVDRPAAQAVLTADADYLDVLFEVIETQFGGIDAYCAQMLGLSAADRDAIAGVLLEDV